MTLVIDTAVQLAVSGVFVGCLVGISGVGGGALMTPLLVMIFGIHPVTAVGTDLLYAAVTKTAGTLVHTRNGTVDWRVTSLLAAGSVPVAAIVLVLVVAGGHSDPSAAETIKHALGWALLLTAFLFAFRPYLLGLVARLRTSAAPVAPRLRDGLTVAVGALVGGLVSITSVGAGAIGTTALLALYPLMPTHRIVASDIAHAVPLTFVAGLGYWFYGGVDFGMLGALLIGSIPGILIGSWLSPKVPERILRPLLAIVLTVAGYKLVHP